MKFLTRDVFGLSSRLSVQQPARNESGAALLEAALVIGAFFFTVFVFIDVCRYFTARTLMMKGVDDAASLAAVASNFDIDIIGIIDAAPTGTSDYDDFVSARERVIDMAVTLPGDTIVGDPLSGAAIEFERYAIKDELYPTGGGAFSFSEPVANPIVNALILRPGESAKRIDRTGAETWVHHPVRCSIQAQDLGEECLNPRFLYERTRGLLDKMPIYVELSATFKLYNPFIGPFLESFPIRVSGMAWRDEPAKSGFREGAEGPNSEPEVITNPGTGTVICPAPEPSSSCAGGPACHNGCTCAACGGA